MSLESFLRQKRSAIVKKWFERIVAAYPANTAAFLKRENNPFANPVGHSLSEGTAALFDALVDGGGADRDKVFGILDRVIRIRAVQEFTPSQAVSFLFVLKEAIREELGAQAQEEPIARALSAVESRIDDFALMAFDVYTTCREKIYELRQKELKKRGFLAQGMGYPACKSCEAGGTGPGTEVSPARNSNGGNGR